MSDAVVILVVFAGYLALQYWVLPKLGVST